MNILFAVSEALPYIKSGGLGDVAGSLPVAINKKGHDCRVVIPLYKDIPQKLRSNMKYITNMTVDVAWRKQYCGIFTADVNGVTYYFLDNEYYFGRSGLYGFYDDCERFTFFSRAILEMLRYIDFKQTLLTLTTGRLLLYLCTIKYSISISKVTKRLGILLLFIILSIKASTEPKW